MSNIRTVGELTLELFDEGWHVIACDDGVTHVTIPSEVEGTAVTFIGSKAFEDHRSLESVVLPDSITFIGNFAFQRCGALSSVCLPSAIKSLNLGVFWGCVSLAEIDIPSSVTIIGDGAFRNCTSLVSMTIPSSIETIGDSAFRGCTALPTIHIPHSVTTVSRSAFRDCSSLSTVNLANSVTYVGPRAFQDCPKLGAITIIGENPDATASAFLNTQTVYLVADYVVSRNLMPFDDAKRLLLSTVPQEKLLGARVAASYPDRLDEIPSKFPLMRALAEAGRVVDLRSLENQPGFFTRANLLRGIDAASRCGQTEAVAYLMDRKAALDAPTIADVDPETNTSRSISCGLEL
ncbi:leucine-rich repeat domain-containing protein [Adlercreutzia sp. ZJ138]|uniref:leucine-rich repeat domain-containing protein n=1 Tax=Adlercreutzia sp. ZJ138 TaxID=2709405 RepID=UPI0013EA31AE|nr:leucine-rich repeat domain-containing protein [Adlercreutzia sp. ZJ138]